MSQRITFVEYGLFLMTGWLGSVILGAGLHGKEIGQMDQNYGIV